MRLVWGGPGRFSGSCDPAKLLVFAGPAPLKIPKAPILTRHELVQMARSEYEIPDPSAIQLSLL